MSKQNKYIDLKINGRLFPSWLLSNFKRYKLPELIKDPNVDPCNRTGSIAIKKEFKNHQVFLSKYLDFRSPFKDILLYHGLGTGKTATAINIYNVLYNFTPGWNVFLLVKASLEYDPWIINIKEWLSQSEYEFRYKNIIFIHYDSPFADREFLDAVKNADSSKKSMYIIDEVHNFIRNVYTNINSRQGKRAQTIYDYIIQDKKENEGVRVVCLSGSPAINQPYELALLCNLLRPNIFPKSESQFNQIYKSSSSFGSINEATKNMFQRRIMGLVSYYKPIEPGVYATSQTNYIDVEMSPYQADIYGFYEEMEDKMEKQRKKKQGGQETYRVYTRQSSNFVFPAIDQWTTGELRPRPNKFRISERDAEKINEGKGELKLEKGSDKFMKVNEYMQAMESYLRNTKEYFQKIDDEDKKNKHTLVDDIKAFHEKYNDIYIDFYNGEKEKSGLFMALWKSSAKMVYLIFNVLMSKGPVLVYSNYVLMEGFQMFKIYLQCFGFSGYKDAKSGVDGFRYTEFHGGIDMKERAINRETFNKVENKHGGLIKIIMISPAGAEGISLANVRQVHIMEPYWHEVRIMQMVGRAIRQCSHKDLPTADRHVEVYRYKSIRTTGKITTDQYIEDKARSKERLIQSFLDAVREVAIDCVLNKNQNMATQEYKCFQFDEPSLFDKQIGPAYKEDMNDDMKIDNGSNSTKSRTTKVKVMKVKAVKLVKQETDTTPAEYSNVGDYWYNSESGVVYDFDLQFPIGKVSFDDDGLPIKLDSNIYIIDLVLAIPMID